MGINYHLSLDMGTRPGHHLSANKNKFLESVMLHHPDFNKAFYMNCDASDVNLGSVLYQEDDEGNHLEMCIRDSSNGGK